MRLMKGFMELATVLLLAVVVPFASILSPGLALTACFLAHNDVIVVAGDSITANGWYHPHAEPGWIARWNDWNNKYHGNYHITLIPSGVSGQNSGQLLARFSSTVLFYHPTVVVIEIGTNDYAQQVPLDTYIGNIQEMIDMCHQAGYVRHIVLVDNWSIGENFQDPNFEFYSSSLKALAQSEGCGLVYSRESWRQWEAAYNPAQKFAGVLTVDGVHPNMSGSYVLALQMWYAFGE